MRFHRQPVFKPDPRARLVLQLSSLSPCQTGILSPDQIVLNGIQHIQGDQVVVTEGHRGAEHPLRRGTVQVSNAVSCRAARSGYSPDAAPGTRVPPGKKGQRNRFSTAYSGCKSDTVCNGNVGHDFSSTRGNAVARRPRRRENEKDGPDAQSRTAVRSAGA